MPVIQFETTVDVENNLIRIPEEYVDTIHPGIKATVRFSNNQKRIRKCRPEPRVILSDDFTTFIDTRGFKFDREEANERR